MRSRTVAALLLLAPAALAAQAKKKPAAARWTEIGRTSQGNLVYLDARSVKREGGLVSATIRAVFTTPVKTPKGDLTSSRTMATFDCAARKVAVTENFLYHDEAKGTVYEHRKPGKPGYGTVIKGALPEVAMNHLCAAKK